MHTDLLGVIFHPPALRPLSVNQSVFHIVTHQETGRRSYISATVASEESRTCCGITIRLTDCIENFDDSGFVAGPRFGQPQVNLSVVRATLREVEEAFDELSGILRMAVTEHAHSLATALADASKTKDAFLDKDVGAFIQFVVPYQKVGSEMQMAIVDRIQGVLSTLHAVNPCQWEGYGGGVWRRVKRLMRSEQTLGSSPGCLAR